MSLGLSLREREAIDLEMDGQYLGMIRITQVSSHKVRLEIDLIDKVRVGRMKLRPSGMKVAYEKPVAPKPEDDI